MIDPSKTILKILKHYTKKMTNNNDNPSQRAESIVRSHVVWSMGAGFIPLPFLDAVAVGAIQLDMIRQISHVYGIPFAESQGKAIISSLVGSSLSRLGASALVKAIPVVGSFVGGASMAAISGASTYAIGQVFKRHFEVGGSFVDFDTSRFQKFYEEQFEKGKDVAQDLKKEEEIKKAAEEANKNADRTAIHMQGTEQAMQTTAPATTPEPAAPATEDNKDIIIKKLKDLAELKDMGVITEEEFTQMKARLIENYK